MFCYNRYLVVVTFTAKLLLLIIGPMLNADKLQLIKHTQNQHSRWGHPVVFLTLMVSWCGCGASQSCLFPIKILTAAPVCFWPLIPPINLLVAQVKLY